MKKQFILAFLLILLIAPLANAQSNPFISGKNKPAKHVALNPLMAQKIWNEIVLRQRQLQQKISFFAERLKNNVNKKEIFLILLFSFLYGIIHALGPGHGKLILSSFFIGVKKPKVRNAFLGGFTFAAAHAGSAIVVTLILYFLIRGLFMLSFENYRRTVSIISAAFIIIIGFLLLLKKRKNAKEYNKKANKGLLYLSLSAGIVPCPGAMSILLFSISLNIIVIGLLSVAMMSLGMAITISSISALVILLKKSTSEKADSEKLAFVLGKIGAGLILILGILLIFISI